MAKIKHVLTSGILSTGIALLLDLPNIQTAAVVGSSIVGTLILPHVVNAAANFGSWIKSKKEPAKQVIQTGLEYGADLAHSINPFNDNQNAWLLGSAAFTTTVAVAKDADPRTLAGITAGGFVVGAVLDNKRVGHFFSELGQRLTTAPSKLPKQLPKPTVGSDPLQPGSNSLKNK